MRKAIASLLPIVIACAGACSARHDTNRNLPPRVNDSKKTRNDLKPYDTPNPGTASGPVMKTSSGEAEDSKDRAITESVRRALMADTTLSADARNVEVVTDDGVVTLRGPVASEREKKLLADKAQQVAGVKRVDNETDVMPVR